MHSRFKIAVFVLLTPFTALWTQPVHAQRVAVRGQVVDAATNDELVGATVLLRTYDAMLAGTVTASEGEFSFF